MKKLFSLLLLPILSVCCTDNLAINELKNVKQKLTEKNQEINNLKRKLTVKNQEIARFERKIEAQNNPKEKNQQRIDDYYRFTPTSKSEINVAEKLDSGTKKIIDKKKFNDTLDISDNFFVYKHTATITQTSSSDFEAVLRNFEQVKSEYADDFYVRVMTFFNGQSLPLENENSKTDIHILIRPTELGYKDKSFIISDFFNVKIKSLTKDKNTIELIFEHGQFPIKQELIIIKPELIKFVKK